MQLLGFIPMKPFKYVHYTLFLMLLLLTMISLLFKISILISSLVHHKSAQLRPPDHENMLDKIS